MGNTSYTTVRLLAGWQAGFAHLPNGEAVALGVYVRHVVERPIFRLEALEARSPHHHHRARVRGVLDGIAACAPSETNRTGHLLSVQ